MKAVSLLSAAEEAVEPDLEREGSERGNMAAGEEDTKAKIMRGFRV